MKKTLLYFATSIVAMASLSGCSDDMKETFNGEGRIMLRPELNADVTVKSRAVNEEELSNSCTIWISSEKGLVRKYEGISNVPAEGIWLVGGHYVAEAWAGDSVSASFENRFFKGYEPFDLKAGQTLQVNLLCKIANVVASVKYGETIDEVLRDYTLTIGHKCGELTFEGRDERKGYFMMPSIDKNLAWTLHGTTMTGDDFTKTGVIEDVEPATEYVLNVKYESSSDEIGGGYFTIEIDETTVDIEDNVQICIAPQIVGVNYELSQPVVGEVGKIGRRSMYISAAAALDEVVVACDKFAEILGLSGNDFELIGMTDAVRETVESKGINYIYTYDADADISNMKINFEEELLNSLTEGDYDISVTATDANGKSSTAVLHITASNAKVMTEATVAADTWATETVLAGRVMQDGIDAVGFNYRKQGTQQWQYVAGEITEIVKGQAYTARLTGLEPGTTYEYAAVTGDFIAEVKTVTTEAAVQLPNAGFEEWDTSSKTYLVHAPGGEMFWDSGNHGSSTAGKNITTPDSSVKHGGNYSAKLASQTIFGVLAAGNIFIGEFLGTENMTKGILGWGRPWSARPKALKGYVKYTPAAIEKTSVDGINKGDGDTGIIYIALVDNSKMSYGSYSGWPQIVATKDIENYSFKKDAGNVIAYGEKIFTEATAGDGMIEFEIPIEYVRTDVRPSNIILACSASRYGDYYTGGASVMYIDDFELVY